jgi:c-di-GMP-binding flagellar brake protein YcgR
MEGKNRSSKPLDRRKYPRSSVYSFMHATATLSAPISIGQTSQYQTEQSWTGLLVDMSCEGAQILLIGGTEKYLAEHQDVLMLIKTTLIETDINLTARVKDIVPLYCPYATRVGVQFIGLESNQEARDVIRKIYEYGEKLKAVRNSE